MEVSSLLYYLESRTSQKANKRPLITIINLSMLPDNGCRHVFSEGNSREWYISTTEL